MKIFTLFSDYDTRNITGIIVEAKNYTKGVAVIAHGMAENKERYLDFLNYLSNNGFVGVIYDHKGHGLNTNETDLGYFGKDKDILTKELFQVITYIKQEYPSIPLTLLGHSMGSLVTRKFLQEHDDLINKCILCGPPTYNSFSFLGKSIAHFIKIFKGEKYRSKFLNKLVFGNYNKNNHIENAWICSDEAIVKAYNESKYCGFIFTINGFNMLFYLMSSVFKAKNYQQKNKNLPLYFIGGSEDKVIGNEKKFNHLVHFFKEMGYQNTKAQLYPNLRHELLNEMEKETVYKDILNFLNE